MFRAGVSSVLRWNVVKLRTEQCKNALKSSIGPISTVNVKLYFAEGHKSTVSSLKGKARLCTVSNVTVNETQNTTAEGESFRELWNNSQFVQSIDPVGKETEAEIIAVVGEKVYVDFGSKFHAVVPLPEKDSDHYVVGARVLILIKDLEMTDHFIGAKRHISLLEAEAELIGLAKCTT